MKIVIREDEKISIGFNFYGECDDPLWTVTGKDLLECLKKYILDNQAGEEGEMKTINREQAEKLLANYDRWCQDPTIRDGTLAEARSKFIDLTFPPPPGLPKCPFPHCGHFYERGEG